MENEVIIDLNQIVKKFYVGKENELEILHGIDLKVRRGEFVSIVGASGSGKSTLMNIIGILDRPTSVRQTIRKCPISAIRKSVLYFRPII